jgi:hypothetical protein
MCQNPAQTHRRKLISHDGLYQRLEEQLLEKENNQIEIKPMTPVQLSKTNHTPKIRLLRELTLDPATEAIQTS